MSVTSFFEKLKNNLRLGRKKLMSNTWAGFGLAIPGKETEAPTFVGIENWVGLTLAASDAKLL